MWALDNFQNVIYVVGIIRGGGIVEPERFPVLGWPVYTVIDHRFAY